MSRRPPNSWRPDRAKKSRDSRAVEQVGVSATPDPNANTMPFIIDAEGRATVGGSGRPSRRFQPGSGARYSELRVLCLRGGETLTTEAQVRCAHSSWGDSVLLPCLFSYRSSAKARHQGRAGIVGVETTEKEKVDRDHGRLIAVVSPRAAP